MIKKKTPWQKSECVYKYQQICLILYTEVQTLADAHNTSGGCTLAARFHSKVATACECALKWTISMLHRNSLYHGEVLDVSDFIILLFYKVEPHKLDSSKWAFYNLLNITCNKN
jgi:hypothetical protein